MIELGAGTATKTGLLLNAAVGLQGSVTYYPIDVSETALEEARTRLEAELPEVTVEPIVADYTEGMRQNSSGHTREDGWSCISARASGIFRRGRG